MLLAVAEVSGNLCDCVEFNNTLKADVPST